MKTGPAILVLLGIVLIGALMFMPRTPGGEEDDSVGSAMHETLDHSYSIADSLVDVALQKLESGELPPMQAVLSIRDVAEKFPENIKANFTLGVMSMQTGQYEKAQERFLKVLKSDAQNLDAHLLLARAKTSIGDSLGAIESLESALETLSSEETKNAIREELASINPN